MFRNARGAKNESGFSLFELIVVIVVIGLLAAQGVKYYGEAIDESRRVGVEALARNFAAAAAGVHAQWLVGGSGGRGRVVNLDNVPIYTNQYGWPVGIEKGKAEAGSAMACLELWQALLQNPAPSTVEGVNPWGQRRYHISGVEGEGGRCRYELVTTPRGTHYFDYALHTGQVIVNVPPME